MFVDGAFGRERVIDASDADCVLVVCVLARDRESHRVFAGEEGLDGLEDVEWGLARRGERRGKGEYKLEGRARFAGATAAVVRRFEDDF